jgi:hypothetical protein
MLCSQFNIENNHFTDEIINVNLLKVHNLSTDEFLHPTSYHSHVGKKLDTTIKICKLPCDLPDNWASLVNTPLPKNKTKKYNTPSVVDAPWVNKNG